MAFLKCPSCTKPCHPKATECKWCGSKLGTAPAPEGPILSHEIEEEAKELLAWNAVPDKPPALISLSTWTFLALLLLSVAAYVVFRERIVPGGLARLFSVFFLVGLGWSLFHRDLSVSKTRFLSSPPDAVRYYFDRCERGLYREAARALVTYPSSIGRHQNLHKSIQDASESGPAKISGSLVGATDYLQERSAVVDVGLTFKQRSYYGIIVAGVIVTRSNVRELKKFVVQRDGRWYLVNGQMNDRIDRRLAQRVGGAS